jgi:hypothetical protein
VRKTYQFSLFSSGTGKGLLFGSGVLGQYLDETRTKAVPDEQRRAKLLRSWLDGIKTSGATEASLESKFLGDVLVGVLGYKLYPSHGETASIFAKPPAKYTRIGRTPDAVLGAFSADVFQFSAVLELKTPGSDLDLPQAREGNETPVEQGFFYGRSILGVRWVLVSDMQTIRLYSVGSQSEYEEFDLRLCVDADGVATDQFRRLHFLLHHQYLVLGHEAAPVALVYAKSTEQQIAIRDSFYEAYYAIRTDLFEAVKRGSEALPQTPNRDDLLQATQRLLDRMLFIYYCEDHPESLIPHDTVKRVADAARTLPGGSDNKVYTSLKQLFREVDAGSPPASGVRVAGYNGELFKDHPIIDHIDLPDSLHDRRYIVNEGVGGRRVIRGVWGLDVFDFWSELNEHLLGHIFEESLSDLEQLGLSTQQSVAEKLRERKANGIFYTAYVLSDFLSAGAIRSILDERAPVAGNTPKELAKSLQARLDALITLRILDPACGSGAFLVSAYRELVEEYWRVRALLETVGQGKKRGSLFDDTASQDQANLLRSSLFGADILPQAVEIAKLALWLRSARKGEKVANLGGNIVAGDSLDIGSFFDRLHSSPGSFDLVIGNPPWGAELSAGVKRRAVEALGLPDADWDSWELFVLLGLRALKVGGRLSFVVPDSLLYPSKSRLRKLLLEHATIEKVHNLGPEWFGTQVRMGTVVLQVRRGPVTPGAEALCALLTGVLRTQAIQGKLPLTQVEAQRSRKIPVDRIVASPTFEIEVFRGTEDDVLMAQMEATGVLLQDLCTRTRGEEINKAGLVWVCPSCLTPTTPGEKRKGGAYHPKTCPECGYMLREEMVQTQSLVRDSKPVGAGYVTFIDGDDVNRRYVRVVPKKWLKTDLSGWSYKGQAIYTPPKILVRQAGVGVVATLDTTDSWCPQSVYVYKVKAERQAEGYAHEFVLGALLSRAMAYYVFKRFSEVDPAKAHAKLTHERLGTLPIPRVDFADKQQRQLHDRVVESVTKLLDGGAVLGGTEDRAVEQALRQLWGLTGENGAYINREFSDLPESQVIRDLFPEGVPRPELTVMG